MPLDIVPHAMEAQDVQVVILYLCTLQHGYHDKIS